MKNTIKLSSLYLFAICLIILSSCGDHKSDQSNTTSTAADNIAKANGGAAPMVSTGPKFNQATTEIRMVVNNGSYYIYELNYNTTPPNTLSSVNGVAANSFLDIIGTTGNYQLNSQSGTVQTVSGAAIAATPHPLLAASITSSAGMISGTIPGGGPDSFSMDNVVSVTGGSDGSVVFGVVSLKDVGITLVNPNQASNPR